MRYYIADLHFFHEGMNDRMDMRGFSSVQEMNAHMVEKWNAKVRKNDEVVILGDLSFGTAVETNAILEQLNGKLYLVVGNHDYYLQKSTFRTDRFVWIKSYAEMSDNGKKVVLSHYPVFCYNGQYRKDKKGNPQTYMLYGHVHNTYDEVLVNRFIRMTREAVRPINGYEGLNHIPCNMINCFCMFSDYTPLTLEEWISLDEARRTALNQLDDEKKLEY